MKVKIFLKNLIKTTKHTFEYLFGYKKKHNENEYIAFLSITLGSLRRAIKQAEILKIQG